MVNSGLNFSVAVHNCLLPENHPVYTEFRRSLKYSTISTLMHQLERYEICEGLEKNELTSKCDDPSPTSSGVVRHTVPFKLEYHDEDGPGFKAKVFVRAPNCKLICDDVPCSTCKEQERSTTTLEKKSGIIFRTSER